MRTLIPAIGCLAMGCGGSLSLTVHPGNEAPAETVPAPQLGEFAYKKILVLPPEGEVVLKDVGVPAVKEKKAHFYMSKLEKVMLSEGFEVLSSEIVARASTAGGVKDTHSAGEKAMILGKETKADAVFMVQNISVRGLARYYDVKDYETKEVDPARVRTDEDGEVYHADTEECLHRIPYYEVRFEGKLVDANTGTVLWVGNGKQTTIDVIQDEWVAEVDDDCSVVDQNFVYEDYQAEESTLDNTSSTLMRRLVHPMAQLALGGKSLAAVPMPVPAKVIEQPIKKVEPKKTPSAVVSSRKASLRAGPGAKNSRMLTLTRKAKVEIVETMGEWHKVKVQNGTVGWLHESTILLSE